ncbi:MAG: PEGA domain-containing protein [Pseudomonadota bacterium]
MKHLFAITAALLMSACSSQVLLTIETDPPGAAVYEGGKYWGRAPVTLSYAGSPSYLEGGCMGTRPIKVEWDSGAQARVSTISVCSTQASNQDYLFTYPEGFPGTLQTAQTDSGVKPPLKRVAPNGQLYWEVTPADGDNSVRCYSDVAGDTVKTNCS